VPCESHIFMTAYRNYDIASRNYHLAISYLVLTIAQQLLRDSKVVITIYYVIKI